MKKTFFRLVALVLALCMAFPASLQVLAAEKSYVSDIMVATASSVAAANKMLKNAGYTPISGNVNEGNGKVVCIGIMKTSDKSEAVTDIAVMNMKGGYSFEDYNNVLKEYREQADALVGELYTAVTEYRVNYKNGKTGALLAHELLNRFYDEDFGTSGNLLGDILADEATTEEQLSVIFMQATSLAVAAIESCLSIACADNWLDRMIAMPSDTVYTTADDDKARTVYKSFAAFQSDMGEYAEIIGAANLSADSTEEDWKAYYGTLSESQQNIVSNYANTYDYLKATEYNGGTLYDFFMQDLQELDNSVLYPMARAMTDGQAATVPYASLGVAIQYAVADETLMNSFLEKAKEQTDVKVVSVFDGVDRSIFSADGIALTSEAIRQATSSSDYSWCRGNLSKEAETAFYAVMGTAAGIAAAGIAVTAIASAKVSAIVSSAYQAAFANLGFIDTGIPVYEWSVGGQIADEWGLEVLDDSALALARAESVQAGAQSVWSFVAGAAKIISAVAIAIVLITVVIYLYEEYRAYNKSTEYSDIPRLIVDQITLEDGSRKYTYYYAVKDTTGAYADLNAWSGKEWNALYYTKDKEAGDPILATAVIQSSGIAPDSSYTLPVHAFGSSAAYNLDKYTLNSGNVYMFFQTDDTASLTGTAVSYGNYALVGAAGIVIGAVLMYFGSRFILNKKKKTTEDASPV